MNLGSCTMWYLMENIQRSYMLSERLLHAIGGGSNIIQVQDDLESLIEQGADVNLSHGTLLPLHCACMIGDPNSVKILLQNGAQVNAYDGYHRTALHYAAEHSDDCAIVLLQSGASVEAADLNYNTPLHWAAFRNKPNCILMLLEYGCNINSLDSNNDTPLSWAAMKGNWESVQLLLQYNAAVDTRNYNGLTPLARSAILLATGLNSSDDDKCFDLLLKACGQMELRDIGGQLPDVFYNDAKLSNLLLDMCSSPRSLQVICRFKIRQVLGQCRTSQVVWQLPVPESVKRFLLLEY